MFSYTYSVTVQNTIRYVFENKNVIHLNEKKNYSLNNFVNRYHFPKDI